MHCLPVKDTTASLEGSCSTFSVAHHVWGQEQADWPVWALTVNRITARQIWSGVTGRQQQQISLMQLFGEQGFKVALLWIKNSMQSLGVWPPWSLCSNQNWVRMPELHSGPELANFLCNSFKLNSIISPVFSHSNAEQMHLLCLFGHLWSFSSRQLM